MLIWGLLCMSGVAASLSSPGYRLPESLLPIHYMVDIVTNLEDPDFSFSGKVWIKIECLKSTNTIILHSSNLTISNREVTVKEITSDNEVVKISVISQRLVPENDFYIIKLDQTLKPGRLYILYIPYDAKLVEGLQGYYRSSYFDKTSNSTKWLAVTQFEPTSARKAFPCFDEPAMKARFSINLGHKDDLKSVSNMPISKTTPMEGTKGWVWDHYEDSVPMSTYLVAFMVSEYEYRTSDQRPNNVTFRTWARKDAIDQVEFARNVGPKFLEYYENYFGVKYPLPKQDMVAIPDFSAGAMENWGLITYREVALLFDNMKSSSVNKFNIARVIAHELAHQWFGNLVTMKWWSDLWLNEGFATYVADIGLHHIFPEWNSFESSSVDAIKTVYNLDALQSSHPVSIKIGNPSEIGQIFDTISYKKGSLLLRMMNMFLGECTFKKGVSNYLKEHRYNNAEQDDLWKAMTDQAHKDRVLQEDITIKEIMDTWTIQTGYPIINVRRNYADGSAVITQTRYLEIQSDKKENQTESCWWVPLVYTTQDEADFHKTKPSLWLNCAENKSVTLNGLPQSDEWVIFNINFAGLYRVQYDDQNWKMISSTLNSDNYNTISRLTRAYLLLDALDLAWHGDLNYKMALSMVKYLKQEKEYIPWKVALSRLHNVEKMLKRSAEYSNYKKFMQDLLTPIFEIFGKLTYQPKGFEETKHHSLIMHWACSLDVGDCVEQVNDIFSKWKKEKNPDENNPIPSDLKNFVYCQAVQNSGEEVWNFLWQRYLNSNVGNEKNIILSSLGCSKEIWILKRYLSWSIDENSGIRKQDSFYVFSSIVHRDLGFYVGRDFLTEKIKDIYKYFGEKNNLPGRYLSFFAEQIINEEEKDEWANFINEHKDLMNYTSIAAQQSIETAAANARWTTKHHNTISKFLAL